MHRAGVANRFLRNCGRCLCESSFSRRRNIFTRRRASLRLHPGSPGSGKKFFGFGGKALSAASGTKIVGFFNVLNVPRSSLRVDQHAANWILFARRRCQNWKAGIQWAREIFGFSHQSILDDFTHCGGAYRHSRMPQPPTTSLCHHNHWPAGGVKSFKFSAFQRIAAKMRFRPLG